MSWRQILHLDLDAFFASVEELNQPSLKGKPIIVGGDPQRRGVVSSASYPAREFGVRSAMPTAQALRLCPQGVLVHPHHSAYKEHSARVMALLEGYTPLMEQLSIDEAFLDMTGARVPWRAVERFARELQARIEEELALPSSLGVATSKLVAKIASALDKPRGAVVVQPGTEQAFLSPLPIERLWGVGPATASRLHELGIRTIGELAALPERDLVRRFGKHGQSLARHARGIDERPVEPESARKSIGHENTFPEDVADAGRVERELLRLSERVARELRRRGLFANTVRLKLRYDDFTTITRQRTLPRPTNLESALYEQGRQLLLSAWTRGRRVRLVGITAAGLTTSGHQLGLFGHDDERSLSQLAHAVDQIRDRFGDDAIQRASLLED